MSNAFVPVKINECYLCGGKLALYQSENSVSSIDTYGNIIDDTTLSEYGCILVCTRCGTDHMADIKGGRYFIKEDSDIIELLRRIKINKLNPPINPFNKKG